MKGMPSSLNRHDWYFLKKVVMDQNQSTDIDRLLELGWSAINTNNYDKALTLSTIILESDPDCPEAYNLRGNVLAVLQHGKAIDAFSKAVELKPAYAEAHYFRGLSHHDLKDYKAAVCDYTTAIKIGFDIAEAYNARGSSHVLSGSYELAISDFSTAIELKPDFALAWFNRGITYVRLESDPVHAMADIMKSAQMGHEPALAIMNRLDAD
jgi:tetratricopeptide (TPR) repeat protein